jgi:hypothetical protein
VPTELGILVQGDNHFIIQGPQPTEAEAIHILRLWTFILPGVATPTEIGKHKLITKAFREDLGWAVVIQSDTPHSPAVAQLLRELTHRGVPG